MGKILSLILLVLLSSNLKPDPRGYYFPFVYAFDSEITIRSMNPYTPDQVRLFDKEIKYGLKYFPKVSREVTKTICSSKPSKPVTFYVFSFKPVESFIPYYYSPNRTAYGNHDNFEFDMPRLLGEWLADDCGITADWRKFAGIELQRNVFRAMGSF